jgi:signal transduction histidine kinase
MPSVLRPLTASATYRRWAFLILGGALLVPYVMLANALGVLVEGFTDDPTPLAWFVMTVGTLAAVVATASVTTVRTVMATGAKELLRGPMDQVTPGRARSWPDRLRTTGWLLAHIVIGGAISVLSLVVPIAAVIALVAPFAGPNLLRDLLGAPLPALWRAPWVPFAGVAGVLALIYLVAATGALLARLGSLLLGPSADERVAAAERRAADLAQRNRLARELHDSVGHALSVVTMQAAAANRVLADDPDFAGQALTAIESQARTALEDLDHVLGLLRHDSPTAPQPTLADLDRLLADTRAAGMDLDAAVSGDLDRVPRVVSREAYRIIQECLTNALRHAAGAPVRLRVSGADGHLDIDVRNPHGGRTAPPTPGGGRGLAGISERATILGGQMRVSDSGGQWRVRVRVPVTTGTPDGRERPEARP